MTGGDFIEPRYQRLLSGLSTSVDWVFTNSRVIVWRKLADRENCTIDTAWPDGRPARLHVKRYPARYANLAQAEATAIRQLAEHAIPCASLAGYGRLPDGRAFVMTEDLTGFTPADKLIAQGASFDRLFRPTAQLAAKLHSEGFHHRDLYLCHFMAKLEGEGAQVKLIDLARVRRLPPWPLTRRWIVKDFAQFWYSTTQLGIDDMQRVAWLSEYSSDSPRLRSSVAAKAKRIAAHDAKLNRRQPTRHISIPH